MRYKTVQKLKFGRPSRLSRADQLLMTLIYWGEYRTEFHIGLACGVSKATVCQTIKKIEDMLIKLKQFHLSGKKALQSSATVIEIVLMDVTEQPIERQKKTTQTLIAAKRSISATDCQSGHPKNPYDRFLFWQKT